MSDSDNLIVAAHYDVAFPELGLGLLVALAHLDSSAPESLLIHEEDSSASVVSAFSVAQDSFYYISHYAPLLGSLLSMVRVFVVEDGHLSSLVQCNVRD